MKDLPHIYKAETKSLFCLCRPAVPEVVEAAAQISAPILVASMRDVLVKEGHPTQFQCTISGEGSACCSLACAC